MYKIFINDKPFILKKEIDPFKVDEGVMVLNFSEIKTMKHALKLMELKTIKAVIVVGNIRKMWKDFTSYFELIEAAGGVVKNDENKLLFIFRLGKWDLPKGKVDSGETLEEAAIREVEEECGIAKLKITETLLTTYHTYKLKNKQILKASHWFAMNTNDKSPLKPQTEENITDVRWVSNTEIPKLLSDAYPSIIDVMGNYRKKQSS